MRFSRKAAAAVTCAALMFGVGASAFGVEMSLAGIKLGSSGSLVLKRFGDPTRITVGSVSVGVINAEPAAVSQGLPGPGTAIGPPAPYGARFPGPGGAPATYYGGQGGAIGRLPPYGDLVAPGEAPNYAAPPSAAVAGPGGTQPGQQTLTEEQVTWTYDLPDGIIAEFIISGSGLVVQITVGGGRPYALSQTT